MWEVEPRREQLERINLESTHGFKQEALNAGVSRRTGSADEEIAAEVED